MTPEQRAREFVEVGFRSLGVPSLEPYIAIIAELISGAEEAAVAAERERCARVCRALQQLITDFEDVPDPTDADGQAVFEEAREALAAIRKGE